MPQPHGDKQHQQLQQPEDSPALLRSTRVVHEAPTG
jgi:hypothetical protein